MIPLSFTPRERELIRQWYETLRERSGHFGDGEVTTPDEAIVLAKLESTGEVLFHPHHLEMLVQWAETAIHTAITAEEVSLLEKILAVLGRDSASFPLARSP